MMRCDLANMLRRASEAIDPQHDHGAYAFMLNQVADHVDAVRDGKHTVDEFADFYMVRPKGGAA